MPRAFLICLFGILPFQLLCLLFDLHVVIKGAPPIAADPGGFPDVRIFRFFDKCRFF